MGSTFDAVLQRLAAPKAILAAYAGQPAADLVSNSEQEELEAEIRVAQLTVSQVSTLIGSVHTVGLKKQDELEVVRALQTKDCKKRAVTATQFCPRAAGQAAKSRAHQIPPRASSLRRYRDLWKLAL